MARGWVRARIENKNFEIAAGRAATRAIEIAEWGGIRSQAHRPCFVPVCHLAPTGRQGGVGGRRNRPGDGREIA